MTGISPTIEYIADTNDSNGPSPKRSLRRSVGPAIGLGAATLLLVLLVRLAVGGPAAQVQAESSPIPSTPTTASGGESATPPPSTVPAVDGYVRYDGWSALPGVAPPQGAWVHLSHQASDIGFASNRRDVYDQPNGQVIGYHYPNLGYVSVSAAASFDDKAARIRMWGCDIELDQQCKQRIAATHQQPNLGPEQTLPRPQPSS